MIMMRCAWLEAPASEPTLFGGYNGPCIDLPPRRLTLAERLDAWHEETWRADA